MLNQWDKYKGKGETKLNTNYKINIFHVTYKLQCSHLNSTKSKYGAIINNKKFVLYIYDKQYWLTA